MSGPVPLCRTCVCRHLKGQNTLCSAYDPVAAEDEDALLDATWRKHASPCTGRGMCHGPVKWCHTCGDVAQVCDVRLRGTPGERCDQHPIPPHREALQIQRSQAERTIQAGRWLLEEGQRNLAKVEEDERARRAYDAQLAALERGACECGGDCAEGGL